MRRKAGATTCTGTSSSTTPNRVTLTSALRRVMPAIHPRPSAAAIEGGRITVARHGFSDRRSAAARGPRRRAARRASSTRRRRGIVVHRAGGPRGRAGAGARRRASPARPAFVEVAAPFATGLHQVDNPVFDRDGQPLRHLQRHARPAGAGLDLPRAARRHARDRSRRASSTRRRWRSTPTGRLYVSSRFEGAVYRVAPDGTAEPFATDLGVACGLAFAPTGRSSSAIARARSSGSTRRRRRRRSRRCRRASRRFTSRSARTARSTSPAPTLSSYDARLPHRRPTATVTTSHARVRPAAGAGLRSRRRRCSSSKRWPARAACIACRGRTTPELVLAGPGLVGVAFDRARRRRRLRRTTPRTGCRGAPT